MKLDFIYFEYRDSDGIWKSHPVGNVKCIGVVDSPCYPRWKQGLCLAIAYHEDGELTKRLFKPLWDAFSHYEQSGTWNHPGYFPIRLVSSEGYRVPVNVGEGNGPHYGWTTHCLFGYLSPEFFSPRGDVADTGACPSTNISARNAVTDSTCSPSLQTAINK